MIVAIFIGHRELIQFKLKTDKAPMFMYTNSYVWFDIKTAYLMGIYYFYCVLFFLNLNLQYTSWYQISRI